LSGLNKILNVPPEVTPWHKTAQLFLEKKLSLPEIGKLMLINEAIGLIPADLDAKHIGINVLDNSALYDALVFGLLQRQPPDKPISYAELARLIDVSTRTVGSSVNRLCEKGVLEKEDNGRLGATYIAHPEKYERMPPWIINLTAALIDLHNQPKLESDTQGEVKETQFYRGFQVLRREIRDKFYRPPKQE
jgi:hypothetical protein